MSHSLNPQITECQFHCIPQSFIHVSSPGGTSWSGVPGFSHKKAESPASCARSPPLLCQHAALHPLSTKWGGTCLWVGRSNLHGFGEVLGIKPRASHSQRLHLSTGPPPWPKLLAFRVSLSTFPTEPRVVLRLWYRNHRRQVPTWAGHTWTKTYTGTRDRHRT